MEKLPHERLREYGSNCRADYSEWMNQRKANELADEIERYYAPLPRDNKGMPYHVGETVYSVDPETEYSAKIIDINATGIIRIRWEDGGLTDYVDPADIQHERPQPKVLDADGFEIKVGENRYVIRTGEYVAVNRVNDDYCLCTVLGDDCTLGTCGYKPTELSTKEPDSLEKLRDDMALDASADGAAISTTRLGVFATRLSALIERGA